jgi:hypothetical protein
MKVKVGTRTYDAEIEPVMLILTDQDKALIRAMAPEAHRYCAYPEGMEPGAIRRWMNDEQIAVTNPIGERIWIKRDLRGITNCCSEDDPCPEHAGLAAEGMTCGFRSGPRGAKEGTQCRP